MYEEVVQIIECRSFAGACVRRAGRMEKIREHGQRNWYDYTKESSTVDWIKGLLRTATRESRPTSDVSW